MLRVRLVSLFTTFLLAACGGGGGGGGDGGGGSDNGFGLTQREEPQGLQIPTEVPDPSTLNRVRAFPNLSFDRPVKITHAGDDSGRLFVVEQQGIIRVFDDDDATATAPVFLDIRGRVSRAGNEEGLLGLAFDPDFDTNGYFYVYYSAAGPRRSVISRFTATGDDGDETSELILLQYNQPFNNHNGGELQIGDDGLLYISSGDGGSGGDPQNNAQDLDSYLGKVLRMELDGDAPTSNPFYTGGGGARDLVWAYGLRNPWRMTFDRVTGELWCGDVGQGAREEIDIIAEGDNLGWPLYEGELVFRNPTNRPRDDFNRPITEYGRGLGASVSGGLVYRGTTLTSMVGAYLYGDFISGRIWALVWDGEQVISNEQVATVPNPSSFGEDENGEMYVCSFDGNLYRFTENSGGPGETMPSLLSQTGFFRDTANRVPVAGVIAYDVNAAHWADGSTSERWIALPGEARIGFAETGAWNFPGGTIFVKQFNLAGRPVETRVLVNARSGWRGYSYRWNAGGTDATLVDEDGTTEDIPVPGGTQEWQFPARADCMTCHNAAAGYALSVRTRQLNRDFDYAARTDNQLRAWNNIGLFDRDIGDASQYGAFEDPYGSGPETARARSYLEVNCASCHLPNGPTAVNIDYRFDTAENAMNIFDVVPSNGSLGLPGERRAVAGAKEISTTWERMRRTGALRMPPRGSLLVDDQGVALVGAWIDSR
ncbi:MAG: PQQ-dependent sugar dehydrogenase [Planctomycetota bacterium]